MRDISLEGERQIMKDFKEVFNSEEKFYADEGNIFDIISMSLNACTWETSSMIIMEELSELIQALSKKNRANKDNKDAYYDLLEEMADVHICLIMLLSHFDIDMDDYDRAFNIKLYRLFNRYAGGKDEK